MSIRHVLTASLALTTRQHRRPGPRPRRLIPSPSLQTAA